LKIRKREEMVVTLTTKGFGEELMRNVSNFVRRMIAAPNLIREATIEVEFHPGILAITADLGFYSCVLNAAYSWGWSAEWASSMNRGLEVCGSDIIRIVIYDRNLPNVDWRHALDCLSAAASQARILLAAPQIDEDLWRTVLRWGGYDVLSRSADSEQLRRELRFAWLSLRELRLHERKETVPGLVAEPRLNIREDPCGRNQK
jgi:hypothetical protein